MSCETSPKRRPMKPTMTTPAESGGGGGGGGGREGAGGGGVGGWSGGVDGGGGGEEGGGRIRTRIEGDGFGLVSIAEPGRGDL